MKKIGLLVVMLLLISSVALASPLTDYSAGKGSIDLTLRNTKETLSVESEHLTFGKKNNLDTTVTVGLSDKFAIQYRNFDAKSGNLSMGGDMAGGISTKLTSNEFNVLYKMGKNINAFAGLVNAQVTLGQSISDGPSMEIGTPTKKYLQVGVVASTQIADKTTLWGSVGVGRHLTNLEVGVGYEFAPNWEFNVNYRNLNVKNLQYMMTSEYSLDQKAKGFGYGITYKF